MLLSCARKPLSIPVVGTLLGAGRLGGEADSERGKNGADRGIDGVISFIDKPRGKSKRAIIQGKSGNVKSGNVCHLRGTLETPSRGMRTGAPLSAYIAHRAGDATTLGRRS
jgi:hypothetical protein